MTPREILEEVKRRIVAAPDLYNQQTFCGTRCCIAGHIDVIVNGEEIHAKRQNDSEGISAVESAALRALNESDNDIWLFGQSLECEEDQNPDDPSFWPYDLSLEYQTAESSTARALIGCKAIDRYIKERGL